MTAPNGRSGSHDPGTLVVIRLQRIAESQPTAWEGETPEGRKVHIAYRFGELSVEVRCPIPGKPGCSTWKTVAKIQPALMEAELPSENDRQDTQDLRMTEVRRMIAERSVLSEIRRSNSADMRSISRRSNANGFLEVLLDKDRLVISDRQLQFWMAIRNKNLPFLINRKVAGGSIPVHVQFAGQEKKAE